MPQSRNRNKNSQHHSSLPHTSKKEKRRDAWLILLIFGALIGALVAFVSAGKNETVLIAGALIGGIIGFFIGRSMDRLAAKKNL